LLPYPGCHTHPGTGGLNEAKPSLPVLRTPEILYMGKLHFIPLGPWHPLGMFIRE